MTSQRFEVMSEIPFAEREHKTGAAGSITISINLLKTILGTGMLALPFAFKELALIPGIVLLGVCGYFARHGLAVYSQCAMRAGVSGDDGISVMCKMVDRRLGPVINFALLAMCLGSAISYLCLIGDILPQLLPVSINRNLCTLTAGIFLLLPLCFIKDLNRLQYTSLFGLMGIIYTLILSLCMLTTTYSLKPVKIFWPETLKLSNVNSIIFVFTCHQSVNLTSKNKVY